jgi:hypothetical protein
LSGAVALLWILGVNAVPAWELFACGWGTGTALVLYWCENVLAALLVALRVEIHRRLTRAAGHFRGDIRACGGAPRGTLLSSFLLMSLEGSLGVSLAR